MKISPSWLRDFVDLPVDYPQLADEITLAGVAVEGISGEGDNTVFEMEITTNRPDAMNHYGVAREASALYDLPLSPIEPKLPAAQGKSDVTIDIQEPELCPRFTAREIRGAAIKPSSADIASRLQLLDQRPISNAVDATNYVLWESGKPTHVFDLDLLEGRRLVIRKAVAGETLKYAGWRGAQALDGRPGGCRCEKAGGAGGGDGRLRHDDHRAHEKYSD